MPLVQEDPMASELIERPHDSPSAPGGMLQVFGLHPLAAFGMIAVDWMLFGEEAATFGAGWAVSVPIAAFLTLACILVQRHMYKDSWGAAMAKGIIIGLLTAIPTAIPTLLLVP